MRCLVSCLFVIPFPTLDGAVVVDTNIVLWQDYEQDPWSQRELGNLWLNIYQDEQGTDPTGVGFYYRHSILTFTSINIDQGSEWYLVEEGDRFESQSIGRGDFFQIAGFDLSRIFNLPLGEFYIGGATSLEAWPDRDVFGWARLQNTGTSIELLSSAVAYSSSGIVVGSAEAIPETSSSVLVALGVFLGCFRRRRI